MDKPIYAIKGVVKQTAKNAGVRAGVMIGLVKPPRPRKPRVTGMTYNREEDKIRKEIIKELRRAGYKVWRIEPAVRGVFGLGDLWVMHPRGVATWLEIKRSIGTLSPDQYCFKEMCITCKINYYIVRSVDEALDIMRLL